ncbi:MAG TPA: hypothetical protein VLA77_01275 [Candidatus Saccharimonadales bacterium]|nr:hypothetical protein [Candidatus Saccharimonadales bacterium]
MLESVTNATDLEGAVSHLSTNSVLIACILLLLLVIASVIVVKRKKKKLFLPVFSAIAVIVISTTAIISGSTIYLNVKSATGGPVHWHADIEFWACGNELELRDPTGFLSNKIGTPTLHEHNDKRIHLEGVPVELPDDASLGKFMQVVGGEVSNNSLIVPINDTGYFEAEADGDGSPSDQPQLVEKFIKTSPDGKVASFVNGQTCGNQPAEVQVFVYNYNKNDKTYKQTKVAHPADYAITGESQVPPGDCAIFEFDIKKDRTDKLCEQFGIRDADKCATFGIVGKREICEIREIF